MKYRLHFLFVISMIVLCAGCTSALNDRGSTYNPFEYVRTIRTGNGAYTIEFRNDVESYYTNFVVTSKGVVAFDPLSDSAAIVYSEVIREHAPDQPLIAIVYSHLHTDHIAGARVLREQFGKDVPIIAHERVLAYFQHYKTPFIDLPTETVSDAGRVYQFGNRTIELRYVGDAHTASILVPVIPEIRMAYICDFANNNVVGWKDLPGINIDEMLEMQRRVLELDIDTVTFCHGPPETLKAVEIQLEYFEAVRAKAVEALDSGLGEDQAAATIDLPQYRQFSNYNDWFKGNVRAMYRWEKSRRNE